MTKPLISVAIPHPTSPHTIIVDGLEDEILNSVSEVIAVE